MSDDQPQWIVTDYGIEGTGLFEGYDIEASRLTESFSDDGKRYYDWPLHMEEKSEIEFGDFMRAWEKALDQHKGRYRPELDLDILARTKAELRQRTFTR